MMISVATDPLAFTIQAAISPLCITMWYSIITCEWTAISSVYTVLIKKNLLPGLTSEYLKSLNRAIIPQFVKLS